MLLSAQLMLDHLGQRQAATRLERAVAAVIAEGRAVTADLGGSAGTKEMGEAVIQALRRQS